MAATTAAQYNIIAATVAGYVPAITPENFNLFSTSALDPDERAGAQLQALMDIGGNTVQDRGYYKYRRTWQTPTAATDATIYSYDTWKGIYPLIARGDSLGVEEFAAILGGDKDAGRNTAQQAVESWMNNIETLILGSSGLLPAMFDSSDGCLRDTHKKDYSNVVFSPEQFEDVAQIYGDTDLQGGAIMTNSKVIREYNKREYAAGRAPSVVIPEYNKSGTVYGGMISGLPVFMNNRVAEVSTGTGVYPIYFLGNKSINWTYQKSPDFAAGFDDRLAFGTEYMIWSAKMALGVRGTTFSGTAGTGIGGSTDAEIGTATNWSKITTAGSSTIDNEAIGVAAIHALATEA
jgi:hypothetical protein